MMETQNVILFIISGVGFRSCFLHDAKETQRKHKHSMRIVYIWDLIQKNSPRGEQAGTPGDPRTWQAAEAAEAAEQG